MGFWIHDLEFGDDDDPSTAMGTETLAGYDLVPEEFAEGSDKSQEFLVVEQPASLRGNSEACLI